MLLLFRNNQFTTAFPLALYVGLTHLGALLGKVAPHASSDVETGVLYRAWFSWLEEDGLAFWSATGAAALVFVQALMVNKLADDFRLLGDRNWLPGLFYALTAACLPDFLYLSPPLVAATFVPMILRRIFKAYKQPKATALVFDAAFWATVASLFYPPAIFLLIAVYFSFGIVRSYSLRERIVSLTGVLTPVFLAWLWYFWTDRGGEFWQIQFGSLFQYFDFNFAFLSEKMLQTLLVSAFLVTAVFSFGTYTFRKAIEVQKFVGVLYWFLFVALLAILLQKEPRAAHFMLLTPSLGIFMAMSFSAFRTRFYPEIFHLALLGLTLLIQFTQVVERS